ncbi:MAG TPA: SDR family oxidoreductase [Polyangiaceae bacterium]|nr:SDR family oxidoreductase [Polyangiaceae bacterium]
MSDAFASFDLSGKVAVVSGALGLLGREHCAALADAGARLVLTDLNADALDVFAARLRESGAKDAVGIAADITSSADVDALCAAVVARFGPADVLVNNAAIDDKFGADAARESRFENYSVERFRRQLDVNVTGPFLCCQRFGSLMAERGRGSIINVASTYGLVAPNQDLYRREDGAQAFWKGAAYPASKGAVLQLTRFLAAYWGEQGVRVNALCPGGVEAGQDAYFRARYAERTPLKRMAAPGDYRGALLFLASEASAYMTGASLVVDGGFTIW